MYSKVNAYILNDLLCNVIMEIGLYNNDNILTTIFTQSTCYKCGSEAILLNEFQMFCKCDCSKFLLDTKHDCGSNFILQHIKDNEYILYCKNCPIYF